MVHVPIEALELSVVGAGSLCSSSKHLIRKDINMSLDLLVRHPSGMDAKQKQNDLARLRFNECKYLHGEQYRSAARLLLLAESMRLPQPAAQPVHIALV